MALLSCLPLVVTGCKKEKPLSKEYQEFKGGPSQDYMMKTYQNVPKGR